jgi:glutamate synthase (NADPH/NADH) small chain
MTKRVVGDERGHVRALEAVRVELGAGGKLVEIADSSFEIPCDLLLLAMGFVGSARAGLLEQLGVELDARNNVRTVEFATSVAGVFAAGDQSRGQSLVVWAIAEGRKAADRVDAYLATRDAAATGMRVA